MLCSVEVMGYRSPVSILFNDITMKEPHSTPLIFSPSPHPLKYNYQKGLPVTFFCWSLANSSNICWAGGGGDMGHLIRVTDVKVTSACNKERRNKIKLGKEASLSQKTIFLKKKEGKK